ncbi:hypothetical protein [Sphingomicrobium astaxanthinifaciens]|uniref:hypothetical protein n=1 Tax=Sphingomicrobium astaxanthinifaciens TaxID=1227949 RepID=UPI001FCBF84F|nr:hypothetical protein [Sphingomicrobium astaxanthinifaciens]MCJ7421737.1 hypothetical protein [Sphingomicrobium astaxanthinifaciens]
MTDDMLGFLEGQVEAQANIAMAHLTDSHWTDLSSGRNVGKDELRAVALLSAAVHQLQALEWSDPQECARAAASALQSVREDHRRRHDDPDGYGDASIRTVIEAFDAYCDEHELVPRAPPPAPAPAPAPGRPSRGVLRQLFGRR